MADPSSSLPLDAFIRLYWEDHDRGEVHSLSHYVRLFPDDAESVAREYLALKDHQKDTVHRGSAGRFGHYRLIRELGGGGQGIVYLARDLKLERDVAIKRLQGRYSVDKVERFRREAKIASRLDHPGICPIYEVGDEDGDPYFVMRFVDGMTLAAKIGSLRSSAATSFTFVDFPDDEFDRDSSASDPPPPPPPTAKERPQVARAHALMRTPSKREVDAVLRLVEQVARALHEAHEAGVVHRDVKPANIIVAKDGQPVLLDFGLATMTHLDGLPVTETGDTPGTPAYMSPEQLVGGKIPLDRRTDVYSLGVTLYECLTLKRPFEPTSQVARQIMFVRPPDPRESNAAISGDLRTVLEVALEKDRDRRYPTAAEFADELRRVRENVPIMARRAGPIRRLRGWVQRNPIVAASLALTFLTLVVALVVSRKALGRAATALSLSEPMADLQKLNDLTPWSLRLWPSIPEKVKGPGGMDAWLAHAAELIARKPEHEAALKRFSDAADTDEKRERVRVLTTLVSELTRLPDQVAAMQDRRQEAQSVHERTIDEQRSRWNTIALELGKDPGFASISPIKPQRGLVPLGRNPQGCEEFAVFGSGAVPKRKEGSGELDIDEESGIVLVLIPGGTLTFWSRPPGGTSPNEKPAELQTRLEPFFIGKYEVTQAQWFRMWKSNPSVAQRGGVAPPITPLHPVEWVQWGDASEFCRRFGLELPEQDQWEFAARARAGLDWGDCPQWKCLEGRENLADESYKPINPEAPRVPWDDGYQMHAPVGSFQPNGFGLHDMLGNVSEWCSDRFRRTRGSGDEPPAGQDDASESKPTERRKVIRGSNWQATGDRASCRWFGGMIADGAQPIVGFRVMRPVER